jgi:hypothetical protein
MKKFLFLSAVAVLSAFSQFTLAQDFGLSFSYFVPKNGYFSAPISPFSIRGLGVDFNRNFAFETGATLYRISGLSLKNLPFEYDGPLTGPNFTVFVPAELVLMLQAGDLEIDLKAGGFVFYAFDQHIQYGHLDKAIREWEGWAVANASASFKNYPGWGYHAGIELTFPVAANIGTSLEVNYLIGEARFPLQGSYSGGSTTLETRAFDFPDARIDFTGLEFTIGVFYQTGRTAVRRSKR